MSFEGTRRVKGLEYCNEWNDARGAARASLDQAGVWRLVQTLFVDGPLTDEYVRNFAGRFLQEANEFYKEAASKFF